MKKEQKKMPQKRHLILRIIGRLFLFSAVALVCGAAFVLSYLAGIEEWQEFDPHSIRENMPLSTHLYDADGKEFLLLSGEEKRIYVPLRDIPLHTRQAFIAVEDTRFYEHGGIDPVRILGALVEDIKSGSIKEGASTISQQLIKHSSLTFDQNISRKLNEIMMAFKLEKAYSKDEILELYLNQIYFGAGAYGVETAARTYFDCPASELSLSQSALLAGIVKSPSAYAPHLHMDAALKRRDLVLGRMLDGGFISPGQYRAAIDEKITLSFSQDLDYPYGYYTDMVLLQAKQALGVSYDQLSTGGYHIYTGLQPSVQSAVEQLAADKSLFPPDAADGLPAECAVVVLRADSGRIAAVLGGREHTARLGFNRATSMRRQPGSAIKPVLVYAPALEYGGYTTTSFLLDQPEDFDGYTPRNSGSRYRGWVTLRDCVAYSINIPAVKLMDELTVPAAKSYASSVGIPFEEKDKNLSLALGGFTTGVTPLELCSSYQPFASGGYYQKSSSLLRIAGPDGRTLYHQDESRYSVLSAESAFLMSSMLSSAVEYGTSKSLYIEGVPLSAKTGTSTYDDAKNNKDAWIVAYNSDYIVCCWMGFDKTDALHSLPQGVTGGTYPAAFARRLFLRLYPDGKGPSLPVPDGIAAVSLDGTALTERCTLQPAAEGLPAVTEYYKEGT
ncbi:MAG: PBP1A family penicillin-binding protein, partial [Christensenellaceae bacterium]|nr:PBP1A family penicillin-binding protein [Christensenellaceae bacterium]